MHLFDFIKIEPNYAVSSRAPGLPLMIAATGCIPFDRSGLVIPPLSYTLFDH